MQLKVNEKGCEKCIAKNIERVWHALNKRSKGLVRTPECAIGQPGSPGSDRSVIFNTTAPLKPAFDAYGREIFIETVEEHTGKPAIWHQLDR